MDDMKKLASVCAEVYLRKRHTTKEAGVGRVLLGVGGAGLLGMGGVAYHQNKLREMYRKGNMDLMAELRPLIAGLRAPQGAYALPRGTGFA